MLRTERFARTLIFLMGVFALTSCDVGIEMQAGTPPAAATTVAQLPIGQPTGIGGPLTTPDAAIESVETAAPLPIELTSELRQWAASASATSELDAEHGADQAAGEPGDEGCTFDGYQYSVRPGGWVSADASQVETLTLTYETPVIPTAVIIHLEMLPNAVIRVDVVDEAGMHTIIYSDTPFDLDFCPYDMEILVPDVTVPVNQVIITLDQTVFGKPTEINAVELVGLH